MIELLAALSAAAAVGVGRIALPLLLIGLFQGDNLWSRVPILSLIHPQVVVGVLTSWSLFELFASKKLLGQRVLQIVHLLFSPIVGAMVGVTIAQMTEAPGWLIIVISVVGGLLALVLQLVQVGLFFRLRGLPLWAVFVQDALCVALVLLAFDAPRQGGLIAMILLWLAIRSSGDWYRWYKQSKRLPAKNGYKSNPD
ncbi:DUF4126 domain-containing protein [Planktothrix sp. FACHB-1355]|uniref:DUF4126 domain-containing protein n=1 Tax=Aerosakkonema funiforme FACHB-1375 TaxID=2949571 RepID=A0A926ZJE9_9CYAN|nr:MULTISPECIES: DUF4126 domain-containing protein [Oscillatoriales]MBD2185468.1 DUF4126 domain-containing protein [Aerosakkonema funiforme FACHB-1375]MBD3559628.1 DUF4126 domain-containing protein [Planktothrix sp. FACHB-1355]